MLPSGWKGIRDDKNGKLALKGGDSSSRIRLVETVTYEWCIHGSQAAEFEISERNFAMATAREWSISGMKGDAPAGRFQMLNFLGLADLLFNFQGREIRQRLEFVSPKLDYEKEYSAMTEEIADFCAQLLLSWNTPTALRFQPDPEAEKRTVLEQFLFLRHFLNDARFDACLEMIRSQPHRHLTQERSWVPATEARSTDFLQNPMAMTRNWMRTGNGSPVPLEVCDVTKRDCLDTPPNRFVKFALEQFAELCGEVRDRFENDKVPPTQVYLEANELAEKLEATLAQPFFKECSRLTRLPLESQVLQKKEGYRDILRSWLMMRSAALFRWEGNTDCHTGTSRNVAELYEYWIFLTLHKVLLEVPGIELVSGEETPRDGCDPFLAVANGEVKINLKKGAQSRVCFVYRKGTNEEMGIDLYYERKFVRKGGYSWSGTFKPDYTLVMYPAELGSEEAADEAGRVSFLHFDAKYKAEKLADVFGGWDEPEGEVDETAEEQRLYQKTDLLKMHTYNDAIKSTAGSYVLYPGNSKEEEPMRRFHEILPGVGAFVLKPGGDGGRDFLKQFLGDVFQNQANRFTQYRYLNDATTAVVKEVPLALNADGFRISRPGSQCVMLWMRGEDGIRFRERKFAYCRAVYEEKDGSKAELQLNIAAEIGGEFVPYGGGRSQSKQTLGWRGKVTGVTFLTRLKLQEWIVANHSDSGMEPSSASHYLLFEFEEVAELPVFEVPKEVLEKQVGSKYMALTCRWSELMAGAAKY